MRYSIKVSRMAALEIVEAFDWYELQRRGLGIEFLDELDALYATLLQNPQVFGYYDKPVREGKINRFPYLVVYELIDEDIVIYSVFMSKKDPERKRKKL